MLLWEISSSEKKPAQNTEKSTNGDYLPPKKVRSNYLYSDQFSTVQKFFLLDKASAGANMRQKSNILPILLLKIEQLNFEQQNLNSNFEG